MSNVIYVGKFGASKELRDYKDPIVQLHLPMPTYQRVTLDNGVKVYIMVLSNGCEYLVSPGLGSIRPLSYTQKTVIARRWVTYTEVEQWLGRE